VRQKQELCKTDKGRGAQKYSEIANIAKITNQGSDRNKNNARLTWRREGGRRGDKKITKLTKLTYMIDNM